jgi:hypothetical protein
VIGTRVALPAHSALVSLPASNQLGQDPSSAQLPRLDVANDELTADRRSARDTALPIGLTTEAAGRFSSTWLIGRIRADIGLETLAWRACVALLVAWALGYLWWPFSNDQGNLAWVGGVIRNGGMPYRDAWDVKGPAAHLLFALAGAMFGSNEWGLRLFDLLYLAIGAWSLSRIAEQYAGPRGGRWAVVLYLLWYASLDHHNTAQPDGWAGVMLTVAVALIVTRENRPAWFAGAGSGALIAICTLIKPTYLLFLALPFFEGVTHTSKVERRRTLQFWGATALGFCVPLALCVAWLIARGALGDWVNVHLRWVPSSYSQLDAAWLNRVQVLLWFFTTRQFAPALPLAIGGLIVVRLSQWRRDVVLLAAWAAVAILGVMIQGQFFDYHWHPLHPPLALLAGLGIHQLLVWRRAAAPNRNEAWRALTAGMSSLAVLLVVGAALSPAVHVYRLGRRLTGLTEVVGYDRTEFGPYGHHGGVFPELVTYLETHSTPDETVVVWGSNAGVNYLSHRASPSPFGYVQPLVDPPNSDLRRRYRDEFIRRLESAPPRYVVALSERVCERAPTPDERKLMGPAEGIMRCLSDIPAVRDFVLSRYTLADTLGPLDIRRRR